MHCLKWMNRSRRRLNASKHSRTAACAAMTKAELTDELQQIETTVQLQSKQLFSLRTQLRKDYNRMQTQLAKGLQVLQDFGLL